MLKGNMSYNYVGKINVKKYSHTLFHKLKMKYFLFICSLDLDDNDKNRGDKHNGDGNDDDKGNDENNGNDPGVGGGKHCDGDNHPGIGGGECCDGENDPPVGVGQCEDGENDFDENILGIEDPMLGFLKFSNCRQMSIF